LTSLTPADREKFAAAYHEAGHAGVAVLLGLRLERVELTPDHPVHLGCCLERVDDLPALGRAVERGDENVILPQLKVLLAGRAAQQKSGFDDVPNGDQHDLETARRVATNMIGCPSKAEELLDALQDHTRGLLDVPGVWAGVEALARELLRAGNVEGDAAHRILNEAVTSANQGGTRLL
jgi:hypothetical protein